MKNKFQFVNVRMLLKSEHIIAYISFLNKRNTLHFMYFTLRQLRHQVVELNRAIRIDVTPKTYQM